MEDDAANLEAVLDPQGEEEVQHEEATEDAEGEEAPQEDGEPEAGDEGTYKYNIYMQILSIHIPPDVGRSIIIQNIFQPLQRRL